MTKCTQFDTKCTTKKYTININRLFLPHHSWKQTDLHSHRPPQGWFNNKLSQKTAILFPSAHGPRLKSFGNIMGGSPMLGGPLPNAGAVEFHHEDVFVTGIGVAIQVALGVSGHDQVTRWVHLGRQGIWRPSSRKNGDNQTSWPLSVPHRTWKANQKECLP